ncbi:MAG TPA: PQQ-binding-like beta-propeller repeat protein [Myxococcota bacterium]|nr:PQQ-binding-like beta-propeller repeat protein [Myxococcota bacterium]HRY93282.1 PQQ-binding-like beta-propeller repeat protein [Myxococcota bacterium]HSA23520.1 PQQ-binding-like beta-propeller repeat protein [Myxococcota bacterium]
MAKWKTIKCPNCAAPLEVEEGARRARCSYCGSTSEVGATGMFQVVVTPPVEVRVDLQAELARIPEEVRAQAARGGRVIRLIALSAFLVAGGAVLLALRLTGALGGGGAGLFEHMQWDGGRQAILHDVTGDGRPEAFGMIRLLGGDETPLHLAAFDLAAGSRLWDVQVQPTTDDSHRCHVVLFGGRLWVADATGTLRGLEPETGQEVVRLPVGEQVEALCGNSRGGVEVWLVDKRALRLDPAAGTVEPLGNWSYGTACGGVWSDEEGSTPTTRLDGWPRARPEAFWPEIAEVPGNVGPVFDGVEVERLLRDLQGKVDFALGRRKQGTRVPAVLAVERATTRVLWKADLPLGNPLAAKDDEIRVAGLGGGKVIVPYQVKGAGDTWHLAAFDAASGQRVWDVVLSDSASLSGPGGIASDGTRVYVSQWTWLRVLSLADGAQETVLGRW